MRNFSDTSETCKRSFINAFSICMTVPLRIEILERVPMILCTFMETFIGVFIYCFPMKKTRKLNT